MAKVVITGSSGRIGRALYWQAVRTHDVIGIDIAPSSSTTMIGDISDRDVLHRAFDGADAVLHAAALHAPHVGVHSDSEFQRTNIEGTRLVAEAAKACGVRTLVFSSTTALYGYANQDGARAVWVDEQTRPQPRTIYHRTKLAAEDVIKCEASVSVAVRIIRLSRCFPEPAPEMVIYRLHRGVDYRDVATAHLQAMTLDGPEARTFVISGRTPFQRPDCEQLKRDAGAVIRERAPRIARAFDERGWPLPRSVDRGYDSSQATDVLGWEMQFGPERLLGQFDTMDFEVLPPEAKKQSDE